MTVQVRSSRPAHPQAPTQSRPSPLAPLHLPLLRNHHPRSSQSTSRLTPVTMVRPFTVLQIIFDLRADQQELYSAGCPPHCISIIDSASALLTLQVRNSCSKAFFPDLKPGAELITRLAGECQSLATKFHTEEHSH